MKTFITSDHHFDHTRMLTFSGRDGDYFRGKVFSSTEEMNEVMIEKWNSVVSEGDKVYHLGDFCMSRNPPRIAHIANALNGNKVLIRGNHDKAKLSAYSDVFKDVRSCHLLQTGQNSPNCTHLALSHFPIHPSSIRKSWVNVHGHTHERGSPEGRYVSVCVEVRDYFPVEFTELIQLCNKRLGRCQEDGDCDHL